jgi:peptide/nickel transport system substrate-binding protein
MHAPRQLSVLALAVALAACARKERRTADDTLVYVLDINLVDLDTRWALSSQEIKISRLLAPALVSVDQPSLEARLELAEAITSVDPRTWDVRVKPGIKFPDGSALTARDVAYTFRSTIDPANRAAYYRHYSERLDRVDVLDERTVRFHLKKPLATFVTDLDFGIVSEAGAMRHGGRWPGGFTVGAGAFQLTHLEPGLAVAERNPHYFGPPPPMRRIEFRSMADINARLLVLVGGSADLMINAVRLDLLPRLEEKPRLHITTAPSALLSYLMLNNADPILADARVRRAIAYAIDRDKIVRGKFDGRAVLATGLIPPGHWAYSGDVVRYDHDPARARALLDEAGFADPDGDGPLPRFTLVYKTSSDGFRLAIARLIAEYLGEVGIAVDVRPFEFATFFADVKKGNYQLASMQTAEIAEPDMYYPYFHSERIPTPELPDLGNRWRYSSQRADELIMRGRHTLERDARKGIYAELQRVLSEDVPIVPLWHEHNVVIANRTVAGFELLPNARIPSLARVVKGE